MENKTAKAPVAKKGNKTTEIIVGAAAMKLEGAVKGILAAVDEVTKLEVKAQETTLKVVDLEDKVGGLEQDLQNKIAQNKIEIKNQYETDKETFVSEYLHENNMTMVETPEFDRLSTLVRDAAQNEAAAVSKAVNAATGALKSAHESEKKVMELEYKTKEANNIAEMQQLKNQAKFMEEQVAHWKGALDDERKAGVERAKAASIGTLNVGASNGR